MTDRELLYTGLKEFLPEVSEKMIDDLLKFSALLLEKNKVMNLTAVTEPTEVVTRHFLDCAALAPHMPQEGRVLDVGTGAGFPGMPLAILCPETEFVLLDALRKRIDFLNEVIETLGLTNVTAVHARAEDFAKDSRASFDMAVSRAVADLQHAQRAGGADGQGRRLLPRHEGGGLRGGSAERGACLRGAGRRRAGNAELYCAA